MPSVKETESPIAIAMFWITWLLRHYPGAGFEDWDKALDNEHELVRAEAITAVSRLEGRGNFRDLKKMVAPRLKRLSEDESPYVRALAAEALKKLGAE